MVGLAAVLTKNKKAWNALDSIEETDLSLPRESFHNDSTHQRRNVSLLPWVDTTIQELFLTWSIWTWKKNQQPLPSMKTASSDFASFYSPENQKIVVAGGWDGGKGLDTVEELPVLFRGHVRSSLQLREPPRVRRKNIMTGFLESINEREGELIQERDENRRLCNEYIAQVTERQSQACRQASAILSCMQDTRSTRGNPSSVPASVSFAVIVPHQELRQPPALTDLPLGRMDAARLQDIEQ